MTKNWRIVVAVTAVAVAAGTGLLFSAENVAAGELETDDLTVR
jgi:hypothetical protein